MDASFKFTKPFCYSMPLMVLYNRSIPIGLSVAITEKNELYSRFLDHIEISSNTSVLCDLGKALHSVCKEYHLNRFICHRHLIERFNSNSLCGYLITKLCQIKTFDKYNKFISYWKIGLSKKFYVLAFLKLDLPYQNH